MFFLIIFTTVFIFIIVNKQSFELRNIILGNYNKTFTFGNQIMICKYNCRTLVSIIEDLRVRSLNAIRYIFNTFKV